MNPPVRRARETVYTITEHHPAPLARRAAPQDTGPARVPLPGAELVTLPGGQQAWAYVQPREVPAPAPQQRQPVPAWAKTSALLMWSASGSSVAAGYGLQLAGPWLEDLALVLAALSLGATAVTWVVRGLFTRTSHGAGRDTAVTAQSTATARARTVLGGTVTATSTATAIARTK
ncbi:hypothetical protein [Streptomyces rubradiris]|uniref:Uncharacterized protein n=1 Tax=Streptomyces rubradiris TaxID=285531 RepID=A0ABQ3RAE0_STRRR|nr:hypothetical protein [Streptomyces rubradiris]GHH26109.1 hypothetical protein GCM10018792_66180 [Streptomyces rubradiris]GHI52823.1 hypothetical protein Srubr_26690 [Streptomyces rubradiris]